MNSFCALYLATELERIIPVAGAGVARFRGDQVAARDQFVALDGGVVVASPLVIFESPGEVEGQPDLTRIRLLIIRQLERVDLVGETLRWVLDAKAEVTYRARHNSCWVVGPIRHYPCDNDQGCRHHYYDWPSTSLRIFCFIGGISS